MKIATKQRPNGSAHAARGSVRLAGLSVLMLALVSAVRLHAQATVTTVTGGPNSENSSSAGYADGNTADTAQFNDPYGLAFDSTGNLLFVADRDNNAIRKLNFGNGLTTTFTSQSVNRPVGVAMDRANGLYVLNKGTTTGGGNVIQFNQFANLLGTRVSGLTNATSLTLDGSTNIYTTEQSGRILRISPAGIVTNVPVVWGISVALQGIVILDDGYIAVSDSANHVIWRVNPLTGAKTVLAGIQGTPGDTVGTAPFATLNSPAKIAKAGGGILVVADKGNHKVKVVDTLGTITNLFGVSSSLWVPGSPSEGIYPGWWDGSACDLEGCEESRDPLAVLVDAFGNVYDTEVHYHLIRKATSTGLTGPGDGSGGGGGGTNAIVVAAPIISPNSGYFPMGVQITVFSTVQDVFYTTDGTDPTTNSLRVVMNGNIGTIDWFNSVGDLTSLRVRAFIGNAASPIVSGQPASTNTIGVPVVIGSTINAGVGSAIVVPVVVNLRPSDTVRSYEFRVEITPNGGAPTIPPEFDALSIRTNDFVPLITAAQGSEVAVYFAQPYLIGNTRGLAISAIGTNANVNFHNFAVVAMLMVPIPPDAPVGGTYTISILQPSATSDGGQTPVNIGISAPTTILVTNIPYLVGDSAPGRWYNAGLFGNNELDNADVNNTFYASLGVRVPYNFSDVFNAMDVYPEDTPGVAGGDGFIRFNDWQTVLDRALRLDTNNWVRAWNEFGFLTNNMTGLGAMGDGDLGPGDVWYRQATIGALPVSYATAGSDVYVPVYTKLINGANIAGEQFRAIVTPNGNAPALAQQTSFDPAGVPQPQTATARKNEIGAGWSLGTMSFGSGSSNFLGYVRFAIPAGAATGQSYTVKFANADGSPNKHTQYEFETRSAVVTVGAASPATVLYASDDWFKTFFGDATSPDAAATADPDHDGIINLNEYLAGTNPQDATSYLHFEKPLMRNVGGQKQLVLSWLSAPGKQYQLLNADTAFGATWSTAASFTGDGNIIEFIVPNPAGAKLYRLSVQ